MKKTFAITGAIAASLTLAACGGDADEPTEAVIDEGEETEAAASNAGTYSSLTEDGETIAISLNEDGSYTVTEAGNVDETGTWEDTDEGTCWTAADAEEATCATFAPGVEDGTVVMTPAEGAPMTFSYEG